jgi:hypothetical protein
MDSDREPRIERRGRPDRRRRPANPWGAFLGRRCRRHHRRATDAHRSIFADRYSARDFLLIVLLLVMTIADGLITLDLLDAECEEANPLMSYLLERGHMAFVLGKYILTAVGLPFVIAFKDYRLFRTRFRVGYVLPVFVALYLLLLSYQAVLMRGRDYIPSPRDPARSNRPAASTGARWNGPTPGANAPRTSGGGMP